MSRRAGNIKKMAAERFRRHLNQCISCGATTKYSCIKCDDSVCLRSECSIPEVNENTIGWEEFRSVAYCFSCADSLDIPRPARTTTKSPSVDSVGSISEVDENSDSEKEQGDEDETLEAGASTKKRGRKSMWQQSHITDMVNVIINDENIVKKLVFTNQKKACNTECYKKVLDQLNKQYNKNTGKGFPFSVNQMRSKFKWCVAQCKTISLTVRKASGIKNVVEKKGYGTWFDLLFPLVKSRDSCDPTQAIEPGADSADVETSELDRESECSDQVDKNEFSNKRPFVPQKRSAAKRSKTDHLSKAVELLKTAVQNDPTREMIQLMREEMQHSHQQEMRYFQMMCNLMMPNQAPGTSGTGSGTVGIACDRNTSSRGGYYPRPDGGSRVSSGIDSHDGPSTPYGFSVTNHWNNFTPVPGCGSYPEIGGSGTASGSAQTMNTGISGTGVDYQRERSYHQPHSNYGFTTSQYLPSYENL